MPFVNAYNKIIKSETFAQKNRLLPRKVYRIVSYEYVDGKLTTFSGQKSAFVFVIGITPDRVLHCLKISEVQPVKFFNWLKLNIKRNLKYEELIEKINNSKIDEIIIPDTRVGTKYFQKVKTTTLYSQQPGTYRTYILKNIKVINEITFDSEEVIKFLKIQKPLSDTKKSPNP